VVQACSVVKAFAKVKFQNVSNLKTALDAICNILSNDLEVPVRIEAAKALRELAIGPKKGLPTLFHIKHVYDEVVMWMTGRLIHIPCQHW